MRARPSSRTLPCRPPRRGRSSIAWAPAETVAQISKLQGGAIGAIYEIGLMDGAPSLILKVYPESLHWKMQKEVNVCALLSGRLGVPVPRVLLADDTKSIVGLNFVLMNKLDGVVFRDLEPGLVASEQFAAYSQMGEVLRQNPSYFAAKFRLYRTARRLDGSRKQSRLYVIAVRDETDGVRRGWRRSRAWRPAEGNRCRAHVSFGCMHRGASLPLRFPLRQRAGRKQ